MATTQQQAPGVPESTPGVVIIGGGQAGLQAADSLRCEGYIGSITVIAAEPATPYQRPPLSKDFLAAGANPAPIPLRGPEFFAARRIELRTGCSTTAIDRVSRSVRLASGEHLTYRKLILATGAANRTLTCDGAELSGVFGLRTLDDAERLHAALSSARRVVVAGAGFIGLEFAATARARGLEVTVLGLGPRPMDRALSVVMGEWFAAAHRNLGVNLRLGESVDRIEGEERTGRHGVPGRNASAVYSSTGERYEADLVVYGIGVIPNTQLAKAAGLAVENGIVVDAALRTSDPDILAIGDCANFPNPHTGTRIRLESVQNATDQARHAARTVMGDVSAYSETPWFWSVQGSMRLQIAGIACPGDQTVVRGDPGSARFSVFCFRDEQLSAIESVNSPADHMAARRLLSERLPLTPAQAADPGFDVKAYSKSAVVSA